MISLFQQKFKMHEVFHIIKSLTYFDDAEQYIGAYLMMIFPCAFI
jgi:hypothetical protein